MLDYSGEAYSLISKEINELAAALGEEVVVKDDLIDKWERQIAAGEIPDLTEGL